MTGGSFNLSIDKNEFYLGYRKVAHNSDTRYIKI